MACLPEFKAGRAEVCRIEKVNDQGTGMIYYAKLPDGYLLDCGNSRGAPERAKAIVDLVNVLMKWEGHWPPIGVVDAIIDNNLVREWRWHASEGRPVPDLSAFTSTDLGGTK